MIKKTAKNDSIITLTEVMQTAVIFYQVSKKRMATITVLSNSVQVEIGAIESMLANKIKLLVCVQSRI